MILLKIGSDSSHLKKLRDFQVVINFEVVTVWTGLEPIHNYLIIKLLQIVSVFTED